MQAIQELIENARVDLDKLNSMSSDEHRTAVINRALVNAVTVHRMLHLARTFSGYTQLEVATKLGYLSAQFVSNWERGISIPPNKAWVKLSVLLSIPSSIIIDQLRRYHSERLDRDILDLENDLKSNNR